MFQARKFTSLDVRSPFQTLSTLCSAVDLDADTPVPRQGATEDSGDLKAVVLHNLEIKHSKSTFPVSLGARVTAVDDQTFSATGEAFSSVCA